MDRHFDNTCFHTDIHADSDTDCPVLPVIGQDELKLSAVMIPIIEKNGEKHILFEVRQNHLSQPGEICFPGGHIEPSETPRKAVIREVQEELLISPENIHDLRPEGILFTPAGVLIYPYSAALSGYQGTFSPAEVKEIFSVPISFFADHEPEEYQARVTVSPKEPFPFQLIPGGKSYSWREGSYTVCFYQYESRIIWGMTAKILRDFIRRGQF